MLNRCLLLVAGVAVTAFGCSTPRSAEVQTDLQNEFDGAPKWVQTKKCENPPISNPKSTVCGVGIHLVASARRMALANSAAQAKGMADIAKRLAAKVGEVVRIGEDEVAVEGVQGNTASDYQSSVDTATKMVAEMELVGASPAATWISPNNNLYMLVSLDTQRALDQLGKLMEGQKSITMIDPKVRAKIKANRDKMLKDLSF